MSGERTFTLEEAQRSMAELLPDADELIGLRARLTTASHAHRAGDPDINLADLKAMEARLSQILDRFREAGVQVKGWAPLLLDFPMMHQGRMVLLCWLEGDRELAWFHDATHGFAGRRPVAELT